MNFLNSFSKQIWIENWIKILQVIFIESELNRFPRLFIGNNDEISLYDHFEWNWNIGVILNGSKS